MRRTAACLLMLLVPGVASAGQSSADVEVDRVREIGPFVRNAMGVEFGAGGLGELWHLNGEREWLAGGTAAVWWAVRDGRTLHVEFHATGVFQRVPRNAFVNGLVTSLRWRLAEKERMDVFAEIGTGVSWSDTQVPPRGTLFNYLAQAGVGVAHRLSLRTHAVAGVRLLHLSNGNREGSARNPDIEALGGYVAIAMGF